MESGGRPDMPRTSGSTFWRAVRESVAGTEQDFTSGNLGRAIVLLSIPMVLETCMEALFGIVDVYFVSSLGADAVAAVGLTESVMTLVYALAMGLSIATTAMVSRRVGEKDPDGAALAATQSIVLSLIAASVTGLAGVLAAPGLLRVMGASRAVVGIGTGYTMWILGGSAAVLLLFVNNAVFRGAGDAVLAMRVLWFANAINIVLDPCLIFGWGPFPRLGVTGAGVATVIGRSAGVVYQFVLLARRQGRVRIRREHLRFDPAVAGRLIRVSTNGFFQNFVSTASWVGLVRIVSLFSSAAVAGYTIAIRIIVFSFMPSWGLSNAAATLVGQNLGAAQPERAARSVWVTGFYNMLFLALAGAIFVIFPAPLVGLFTSDKAVLKTGIDCLRYLACGYPFYAWGMVMVQSFNGAGDTATPTMINLVCFWLIEIPLAWALARVLGMGPTGVFLAIPIAESAFTVVAMLLFRRGRWKTKRI
ncbi:MAG: MATE family efflux transporter [Acidobacteria bacterium]|nr:MATE family efflux transporter [Acidobacteriota bacterium]